MLSYQHAYHAGSPADLHKHWVLGELIAHLTLKPRGIAYVETHAGRGLYDLAGAEAAKTGEAAMGIGRLAPGPATPYGAALARVRDRSGPAAYPGSPLIAQALLRPQDRMTLMELHPAEHAALVAAMAGTEAALHRRDGFEGVLALAPFRPRKGLVLVDPSYEVKADYAATAVFAARLLEKWPEAVVAIWYPLLAAGRHGAMLTAIAPLRPLLDAVVFDLAPARGMLGSGLAILNAPHGFASRLPALHAWAAGVMRPA